MEKKKCSLDFCPKNKQLEDSDIKKKKLNSPTTKCQINFFPNNIKEDQQEKCWQCRHTNL